MTHVFISYSRSTLAEAERVEQALATAGYDVWRDNALPVHRAFAEVIEERLTAAAAVIVLWSKDAVRSEWVRSEANRARELGKLVQVSLDRTLPPMPFDQLHCADLEAWTGAGGAAWTKVLESLSQLAGAPPLPPLLASNHALPPKRAAAEPLVAVLAFDNLSGDADVVYFSDGLSEEILHAVSHVTGVKVVARSSSFQLRGVDKTAAKVASLLGATHLLDGAVRRSGDRVRISAQLVDCATQITLWTDRFDRDLTDIFALQDEVAGAVAAALDGAFAPRGAQAANPVAYDLYLRARQFDPARMAYDVQLLDEAVAIAPDFLQAWEALALSYAGEGRWTNDHARIPELRARMEAAAAKAEALNSASAIVRVARAMLTPLCGAFLATERLVAEALSLGPSDLTALSMASSHSAEVGRNRVGLAYARQAYEIDPLYPLTAAWYAGMLATNHKIGEATALLDAAVARWPNDGFVRILALGKDIEMQDWDRFARHAAHPGDLGIYTMWRDMIVAAAADIRDWTPEIAARSLDQERAILAATGLVRITQLGHLSRLCPLDEVYALIEAASFEPLFHPDGRMTLGENGLALLFEPANRVLRTDPRFVRFCARLGFCDYWIETDRWPDCAEELAHLYDFRAEARVQAASVARERLQAG